MSTRRTAVIIYGINLPTPPDYNLAVSLEEENKVDVIVDGMSGNYFVIGRKLHEYKIDDEFDDDAGVVPIELDKKLKTQIDKQLITLFPNKKPGFYYVTDYK